MFAESSPLGVPPVLFYSSRFAALLDDPGDDGVCGTWGRRELQAMDLRFCEAMEQAFASGGESRTVAAATVDGGENSRRKVRQSRLPYRKGGFSSVAIGTRETYRFRKWSPLCKRTTLELRWSLSVLVLSVGSKMGEMVMLHEPVICCHVSRRSGDGKAVWHRARISPRAAL